MNLTLCEEQEMLKTSTRDYLTSKFPKKVVKELEATDAGYSAEIWKEMADLGWMGLVFPERYGGANMSFLDLAVLMEEMGRACVPGPFFSTVILGGLPILDVGTDEQKQKYLPGIASGKLTFTLALTEPEAGYDAASIAVKATRSGNDYVISGTKLFVPDAHIVDYMLCVACTGVGKAEDRITIFIVDAKNPSIKKTLLKTIANDKLFEVVFDNVKAPEVNILGKLNGGWPEVQQIIERSAVAKCCDMVGGMQRVLEMTVDYARDRKQFDRPIGSFQIIQHYCADIATDVDGMRLSTYQAAWMLAENLPCKMEIAIAKAWANQASVRIMSLAHQIHGAIGLTIDHDLHYYTRRAKADEVTFGDAAEHREVVAKEMGL
ncbi:acyl-CoA dehydrogenase family protein [Chloroflexota bacterium]